MTHELYVDNPKYMIVQGEGDQNLSVNAILLHPDCPFTTCTTINSKSSIDITSKKVSDSLEYMIGYVSSSNKLETYSLEAWSLPHALDIFKTAVTEGLIDSEEIVYIERKDWVNYIDE